MSNSDDYDLDAVVNDFDKPTCCDCVKKTCKWFALILLILIVLAGCCFAVYWQLIKTKNCDIIYKPFIDTKTIVIGSGSISTPFVSFSALKSDTYAVYYDSNAGSPLWTANRIGSNEDQCEERPNMKFKNNFGARLTHEDYTYSRLDRGHMTPSADVCRNKEITFDMINVAPQIPKFNRGIWRRFEDWLRRNYAGHVVVTVKLQKWGDEEGTWIELKNDRVYYPIGFCKIVLGDNDHVIWWGCIRQLEQITYFDELLEKGDLHPPQYKCRYPIGD